MIEDATVDPTKLYQMLLRTRPAELGSLLKRILRVRRRVVTTRYGFDMWVDPASLLGYDLLRHGAWDPNLSRIVAAIATEGTFVDVGAHEGYFSVLASRSGATTIHAIEPQSRLQSVIARNFSMNAVEGANLHRVAASDHDGTMTIRLLADTNTGGSSAFRERPTLRKEEVRAVRLDDLLPSDGPPLRLVKVDCEGGEHGVIRGATALMKARRIEHLVVDYHPSFSPTGQEDCARTHALLLAHEYALARVGDACVYHPAEARGPLSQLPDVEWGGDPIARE